MSDSRIDLPRRTEEYAKAYLCFKAYLHEHAHSRPFAIPYKSLKEQINMLPHGKEMIEQITACISSIVIECITNNQAIYLSFLSKARQLFSDASLAQYRQHHHLIHQFDPYFYLIINHILKIQKITLSNRDSHLAEDVSMLIQARTALTALLAMQSDQSSILYLTARHALITSCYLADLHNKSTQLETLLSQHQFLNIANFKRHINKLAIPHTPAEHTACLLLSLYEARIIHATEKLSVQNCLFIHHLKQIDFDKIYDLLAHFGQSEINEFVFYIIHELREGPQLQQELIRTLIIVFFETASRLDHYIAEHEEIILKNNYRHTLWEPIKAILKFQIHILSFYQRLFSLPIANKMIHFSYRPDRVENIEQYILGKLAPTIKILNDMESHQAKELEKIKQNELELYEAIEREEAARLKRNKSLKIKPFKSEPLEEDPSANTDETSPRLATKPLPVRTRMQLPTYLESVLERLAEWTDYDVYIVGGAVRDERMGVQPMDFDIATNRPVNSIMSLLDGEFTLVGKRFPIFEAIKPETGIQISLLHRKPVNTIPAEPVARPDGLVTYFYPTNDTKLDASLRDFTCNALYYDIRTGIIIDHFDGLNHIKHKQLRFINPSPEEAIKQDATLILRAIRLMARFDFTLSEEDATLIKNNIHVLFELKRTQPRRFKHEMDKTKGLAETDKVNQLGSEFGIAALFSESGLLQSSLFQPADTSTSTINKIITNSNPTTCDIIKVSNANK